MDLHLRWMIRRDLPSVMNIDGNSFAKPWSEDNFLDCLRQRNCIGMVAEDGDNIVGYMLYELHRRHLSLMRLAVSPWNRHQGVGSKMVGRLVDKLPSHRRNAVKMLVDERNMGACLFLKACGFKAVMVERGQGEDGYDAIRFKLSAPVEQVETASAGFLYGGE